jgi:perosamine synthetase
MSVVSKKTALAIHGGPKTVTVNHGPRIPCLGEAEKQAVRALMDEGCISIADRAGIVEELEEALKSYFGAAYALSTNTGTAAIHSGLYAVGVGPGDEVLVPSYTWLATVSPVLHCGAVPVFCDIDPKTLTIDPADMKRKISARTKAAIPVHLWGHPAEMDEIMELSASHGFAVVEDASHAHGGTYRGRKVGTIGHVGCFSMQAGKAVAAGEGGFLVTDDQAIYERAMLLGMHPVRLDHCLTIPGYVRYAGTGLGHKYRIHPLAAAIALVQLRTLDERNADRNAKLDRLTAGLMDVRGITPPYTAPHATRGGYYGYRVVFDPDALGGLDMLRFIDALNAEGVLAEPERYVMLHLSPLYRDLPIEDGRPALHKLGEPGRKRLSLPTLPVTESVVPRLIGLHIAHYAQISDELVDQYIEAFHRVAEHADELKS